VAALEKPAALAIRGWASTSHDETGCQMTGDKFRARAGGYVKPSRPAPNKVSLLNSLAWSDASSFRTNSPSMSLRKRRPRRVRANASAPKAGALPIFTRSEPQAATLPGLTSRSLLEFAIGIDRGFIASGISRTRSTCRSPFSRLAPLTLT
jgi:hypothetical protein